MIWLYTNLCLLTCLIYCILSINSTLLFPKLLKQNELIFKNCRLHIAEILCEIFLSHQKYAACLPDQNYIVSPKSGCLQKLVVTILYKRYPESQQMAVAAVTDFVLSNCD